MDTVKEKGLTGLKLLDFPVEAQDVFRQEVNKIEGFKAIVRPDSGKVLGMVRKNYTLVPHRQALEPVINRLGQEGWDVNTVTLERQGAKAFIEMINKNNLVPVKVNDLVAKRLTLLNSYDGSTSIRFEIGSFRLVCLNGLVRPSGQFATMSFRHTAEVLENISEASIMFDTQFKSMIEDYMRLNEKMVDSEIAEVVINEAVGKRKLDHIKTLWAHGQGSDGRLNAWNLYNAITQYLTHEFKGGTETRDYKSRVALDRLLEAPRI